MKNLKDEKIVILDAGSQYGKVIDRRVRESNCYCDLRALETKAHELIGYKGIIISGGPNSFEDPNAPRCDPEILNLNIPILGICYGMQWLNYIYGGCVSKGTLREDGQIDIEIDNSSKIFDGLQTIQPVLLTHGDSVSNLPTELKIIGKSENAISAIEHGTKPIYGLQFHPEVDLTTNGVKIFKNFLFNICNMLGSYTIDDKISKAVEDIQSQVKNKDVVVLISGGVDSSVCSALLYKALGADKVHGIHINTGFMRFNEDNLVKESLEKAGFKLSVIHSEDDFLNGTTEINGKKTDKLRQVIQPEEKRKIIGDTFIKVVLTEIEKLGLKEYFLAQGTLRPDLIESASSLASHKADVIKTHHNDTALVRVKRQEGLIVEPLKEYHKDEVRQIGKILNLPEELLYRHPFPGPGLAIRILCLEDPYITENFAQIQAILTEKFSDCEISAKLLPIRSVGVQGDCRSYSYVVGLTGTPNWKKVFSLAKEIPKSIHLVNRIVYILGSKIDSSDISTTKTYLNEESINQLKLVDFLVNQKIFNYDNGYLVKKISQLPVILAPISFSATGLRSIVLRPFITNDFMTGRAAVPGQDFPEDLLNEISEEVTKGNCKVSKVLYDLTSKPPGTTEWE